MERWIQAIYLVLNYYSAYEKVFTTPEREWNCLVNFDLWGGSAMNEWTEKAYFPEGKL